MKGLMQGSYYKNPELVKGYADIINMQHDSMVSMLHDKSNAGPKPVIKDAIPKPKIY